MVEPVVAGEVVSVEVVLVEVVPVEAVDSAAVVFDHHHLVDQEFLAVIHKLFSHISSVLYSRQ